MKWLGIHRILICTLLIVISCETEEHIFRGPYHVRFTESSETKKESYSKEISIQVHNAGPALDEDVTINYSISGSAREGVDYTIQGTRGVVTIENGDYFGFIDLQLINNANNILRTQNIVFTLLTVDNENLQVGQGQSAIGKKFIFTIEDDCILGGNYYGIKDATSVPVEDITITSIDCEEYVLSNWDVDVFEFPSIRDLTFIDNGDNTLTIPRQEESTLDESEATIEGFGVVDPLTREITMTVILVDLNSEQHTFKLIPD